MALILAGLVASPDATAQNRDLNAERLLLDDDAGDGTRNILRLQVPPTGLAADRVLTFPDAGGTVMTGIAPVTPGQILFGGPAGQTAQSGNLFWDNGAGIFNIGAGNFTVTAATGNTSIAGTLAVTGATSLSSLALTGKATSASTVGADPGTTLVTKDYLVAGNLAVATDATLTGDGTTGTPLGLDLSNANTWTATQTLPTTAAQGDALIASTNAGTTTVDAARIGAGLTDAQVNDNLTINGGSVDATPIGATTPSTGAFTNATVGSELQLVETGGGTDYVGFQAPAAVALNQIWTLPGADGTSGQVLSTDGAGVLSWITNNATVTTDATLTGDGSGGSPLGIDLANANTWTGTQTLPTTAAQGDALIASTNAGATTIDAARIGAGLTDAQVNDNLTINGGTVDASPIGATTPSTGAFTTITGTALPAASTSTDLVTSNGGALETRTLASLSGSIGVSTDATLTGDGTTGSPLGIDLANGNTWTGTQTLPTTAAQGDALIASTNAGTTTIDAARIGAGLTDAQVNDNLTISGGTVDGSAIGATTPSTGAFTTVSTTGSITVNDGAGTDLVITEGGLDRSSGSAEAIQLNNSGAGAADLLINGATQTTNSRLTVNEGHWTSEQATAPTGAGTVDFSAGSGGSVAVTGTDVAGTVNATAGATTGASTFTVTFNQAYGTAPIVVISPANAAASTSGAYVSATNTTTFTVTATPGTAASHLFNYHVIEVQ